MQVSYQRIDTCIFVFDSDAGAGKMRPMEKSTDNIVDFLKLLCSEIGVPEDV